MRYTLWLTLLSFFLACDPGQVPEPDLPEPSEAVSTIQYREIEGVDPNLLSLDIYHKDEAQASLRPVIVYVHGGGWSIGDKANQIDDKRSLFRGEDYVFVSTNYRLTPINGSGGTGRIMFPDHNKDVATAIRWVYDNIADYGGDPNRIALLGHSAGAHLVALTGTNPVFLEEVGLSPAMIRGVASIDTEGYDVGARVMDGSETYINAFGTNPEVHRQASPLYNLETGQVSPNFFIAKRGSARRLNLANSFIDALEGVGVMVQEVDGSIYSHAGINAAIGDAGETVVTPALLSFFGDCFR